jgi:hypothetical protein
MSIWARGCIFYSCSCHVCLLASGLVVYYLFMDLNGVLQVTAYRAEVQLCRVRADKCHYLLLRGAVRVKYFS